MVNRKLASFSFFFFLIKSVNWKFVDIACGHNPLNQYTESAALKMYDTDDTVCLVKKGNLSLNILNIKLLS